MSSVNTIPQAVAYGNTGVGGKYLAPAAIQGVYIVPRTWMLTATQLATPATAIAALQAATMADNPLNRVFPIYNLVSLTDGSEAAVKEKLAVGSDITVRIGTYTHGWRIRKGGVSLLRRLQNFNQFPDNISILTLDVNGMLLGTSAIDTTGAQALAGCPIEDFLADKWKFNDFTKTTELMMTYNMFPQYWNSLLTYIPLGTGINFPTTIFGLQDINIQVVAGVTPVVGTFPVKVFLTEPAIDITSLFSAALAQVGAWTLANATTGASITLTTATYTASGQYLALAATTTAPPYPASGNVLIGLVGPTEMAALSTPMPGYECASPLSTPKT